MSHEPTPTTTKTIAEADRAIGRRDALGALGLAGAAAAAGAGGAHLAIAAPVSHGVATSRALDKPYVPGAEHFGSREERFVATTCGQCPAGCGIRVRVVEGRAVRIEGDPANPINRGAVGPRGLASLQALYDADRIPGPLVRKGGRLVPITWDAALALATEKLAEQRARAPQGVLVMTGSERGFVHDLLARFAQAYGTPNFVDGRPTRSSTLAQATLAMMGTFEVPIWDVPRANYVLSLGAGMLEDSCHVVFLTRAAAERRSRSSGGRAQLVHASSTFDLTAQTADDWILIRPGSVAAIALGIAHVLVRDAIYDADAVANRVVGFDEFARWVLDGFAPERVAGIAGVSAEVVERLARELVSRKPSCVYADERTFAFSNAWETALSVLAVNALLGAVGPLVRLQAPLPYARWPDLDVDDVARAGGAAPRLDRAGTAHYPLARSVHETLPEALVAATPGIALLDHANPAYSRQQPDRWRKALAAVPFVVSFSPFRDETVESIAHLVLPDHTFLERWDDADAAPADVAVAGVRRPVVAPLLDTRATGDVILELARRLGGSVARSMPWRSARDALEARLRGLFDARRGSIVEANADAFFRRLYERGSWTDAEAPASAAPSVTLRTEYADAHWQGDEHRYPFKLLPYRSPGYAEGGGANLPWLRQMRTRPDAPRTADTLVSVHPDDLRGIRTGDTVEVTSPFGTIVAMARIEPRMVPGCVAIPMGGGHEAFGRWARGRGANVLALVAPGASPHSGADIVCTTRVRVARKEVGA
jgi:anaerobic selenocysteine-containing dehydrogenase